MNKQFLKIILIMFILMQSCDFPYINDGDDNGVNALKSKFYMLDRENSRLLMLNRMLDEEHAWDLSSLSKDSSSASLQGITFDGDYLWISISGSDDQIIQIQCDSSGVRALKSFNAPPDKKGVVRDIAFDGISLWALNSGSVTYSMPPALFEINPLNGTVVNEYVCPCPEPRGMTYVPVNGDVYGRGTPDGLYFSDKDLNKIFYFSFEKRMFLEAFDAPIPPHGNYTVFPLGLTYDGTDFWLVNSSGEADLLYQLNYKGNILNMFELPYTQPGAVVLSDKNVLTPDPPLIYGLTPNVALAGDSKNIKISGKGFINKPGLTAEFNTPDIVVNNLQYISDSEIIISVTISSSIFTGSFDLTVSNYDGQSGVLVNALTISDYNPDNGYMWFTDAYYDILYKIKVEDLSIVKQWDIRDVAPGGSPQGLMFDGSHIWLSAAGSDDEIIRLNTSEDVLQADIRLDAPPDKQGTIREICTDGTDMYALNGEFIYIISQTDGSILNSIATPGSGARGIAMANDLLYCNDYISDSVYVFNSSEDTWQAVFTTPIPPQGSTGNRYPTGMAFDGVNFWLANSTYEYDYIFQVDMSGNVIRTFEVPGRGDAQPTGVLFTRE